jgi:cytochrome c551/c552
LNGSTQPWLDAAQSGALEVGPALNDTAPMKIPLAIAFALFATAALPVAAADGGTLAADHGCLNCHGVTTHPHEAPLLKDLSARLARRGDTPEALNHALHEMQEKGGVHGHRFASDEAALLILRWMAQGAKQP